MNPKYALVVGLAALVVACAPQAGSDAGRVGEVRREVEAQIARGVEATRNEDIDGYMEGIPDDYAIYDESGEVITRAQMRANALRDWNVISQTLDLTIAVDSLVLSGDSTATVYTSQRWERMMARPDRSGEDTVLTTQRHRETWRLTAAGWRNYAIDELGGGVWINGEPYPAN